MRDVSNLFAGDKGNLLPKLNGSRLRVQGSKVTID